MTRPTKKEIGAMADVAGLPVSADVAARIANSIGPAFEGFGAGGGHAAVRSGARQLPSHASDESYKMSAIEPALMSLTSVAKAIADKRVSSREVTKSCLDRIAQWQPRLNAFMAIEAEEALAAADATDAALSERQIWRPAARRAAGAQGHVLRRRQGGHLRFEDPSRFCSYHDVDCAATA